MLFRPLKKEECCHKIGIDPSFFYIGFVGSFFIHQGINTLIDAAPGILSKFTNTRFLLIGDGPMMDTWKNKVNQKGLQEAFIFTCQVSYKKVPEYICAMDIWAAPHQKTAISPLSLRFLITWLVEN